MYIKYYNYSYASYMSVSMTRKIDLNELKEKYISKTFGWLTVIDAYKDSTKGRYFFKCKCKCGNEVCKPYDKVISGHTSSCGCYKHSKEYSNYLSEYWKENSDKVEHRADKCIQWCKDNHDKVAERGKKHSQFYKEHPEALHNQIEKRKQTLNNDPSIQETINSKLKLFWNDERKAAQSDKMKQFYNDHPEVCNNISQSLLKYYKDNPEKIAEISKRNKEWCKNNYDKVLEQAKIHSSDLKNRRLSLIHSGDNTNAFIQVLHPSQVDKFINGEIKGSDEIFVKCSLCGEYESRTFNNVWRLTSCAFKNNCSPICSNCINKFSSSSYEEDIHNFISELYSGECVRNSRSIIHPFELDLYYPEKKIAIEYNGSHWHNESHKPLNYHYDKFKKCYDLGITLVSIFESDWNESRELVISYLKDLFNGIANNLSFIDENTINLNYPPHNFNLYDYIVYTNYYISRGNKVYTCGYANNSLKFLADVANENNLQYFVNDHNDLEIKDKNICFHLADLLSGENDAPKRWQMYHDLGKRCVFIYQPDLKNENRVNVYKNILLYHCGLAKRIYARNTVIKKYKAIKMKRFFEENNIAGYRNASVAYVLEDKLTHEPYMCYLIGHNYFGKGSYDCEIARGACKLGYQIVGGASKLWKHIIDDNPNINSIVYYCDKRQYDQRSISHLMDSNAMKGLGTVHMLKGSSSFMNYWVNDTYIGESLWHKAGEFTNREPSKHKLVIDAIHNGDCVSVVNPGSFTNIFVRTGYHLEGMKVVRD